MTAIRVNMDISTGMHNVRKNYSHIASGALLLRAMYLMYLSRFCSVSPFTA